MKLGGFGFIADYKPIGQAGYDYAELDMPEIEALNDKEFGQLKDTVAATGFPVLTGARILPITAPTFFVDGFRPNELAPYLKKSCKRSASLGIRKVILGNGKARSLQSPEDIGKETVFFDLLRMMAEIAGENGQEMILEPLGPRYSNYINTLPEAVRVIEQISMPNLFTMADLRHMVWSDEPFRDLVDYAHYIHHIHVDYPTSYPERKYPAASDGYAYADFLQMLTESQYDDTLTIEAEVPKDWKKAFQNAMEVLGGLFRQGSAINNSCKES